MKRLSAALLLLVATAPLHAAEPQAVPVDTPPRFSTMVVFGDDPCPRSRDDEIVVCARQPESERYRIPKELRKKQQDAQAATQSWVERARTLDMVSKKGLPNSCSPHGSGGQTGCMRQFLEAARAEREADKAAE
jgi:hypothetical protein